MSLLFKQTIGSQPYEKVSPSRLSRKACLALTQTIGRVLLPPAQQTNNTCPIDTTYRHKATLHSHDVNISPMLTKFANLFVENLQNSRLECPLMRIKLIHYRPISARTRRWSPDEASEISTVVDKLASQGHNEPSNSHYRANCRLVPKKNEKKRLVIDYIPLNRATLRDEYLMPNMADLYLSLAGTKYFSTLDATEGFHPILIHPEDRHLTSPQVAYTNTSAALSASLTLQRCSNARWITSSK